MNKSVTTTCLDLHKHDLQDTFIGYSIGSTSLLGPLYLLRNVVRIVLCVTFSESAYPKNLIQKPIISSYPPHKMQELINTLTVEIWEKGTNPRSPSTATTTPPLLAESTCTPISHHQYLLANPWTTFHKTQLTVPLQSSLGNIENKLLHFRMWEYYKLLNKYEPTCIITRFNVMINKAQPTPLKSAQR